MKTFNRKPKQIKAIQYDGTEGMAEYLDEQGYGTVEYDERGIFEYFISNNEGSNYWSTIVKEGDYIVNYEGCSYCEDRETFEEEYE